MTIYLVQGVRNKYYTELTDQDDWEHLTMDTLTGMNSKPFNASDKDTLERLKRDAGKHVVYGQSTSLERREAQITGRSILFIDVDDSCNCSDAERIHMFGFNHIIYPTVSNGVKAGGRFRVGIQLDRLVDQTEYKTLHDHICTTIGIEADRAIPDRDFSHLMGLYIKTTQNAVKKPLMELDALPLPVDEFLKEYRASPGTSPQAGAVNENKQNDYNGTRPQWAENSARVLLAIDDPEAHYLDFGGWDNMITAVGGWVFKQTRDIKVTGTIVFSVNDKGADPIPDRDLQSKMRSWAKNWSV